MGEQVPGHQFIWSHFSLRNIRRLPRWPSHRQIAVPIVWEVDPFLLVESVSGGVTSTILSNNKKT